MGPDSSRIGATMISLVGEPSGTSACSAAPCHDQGAVCFDEVIHGVVSRMGRQPNVDVPVNVRQRGAGIAEDDDCSTIGTKHLSRPGHRGSDDLVRVERLTDTTGETMDCVEISEPLVDCTVRLDDVPQHRRRE